MRVIYIADDGTQFNSMMNMSVRIMNGFRDILILKIFGFMTKMVFFLKKVSSLNMVIIMLVLL